MQPPFPSLYEVGKDEIKEALLRSLPNNFLFHVMVTGAPILERIHLVKHEPLKRVASILIIYLVEAHQFQLKCTGAGTLLYDIL